MRPRRCRRDLEVGAHAREAEDLRTQSVPAEGPRLPLSASMAPIQALHRLPERLACFLPTAAAELPQQIAPRRARPENCPGRPPRARPAQALAVLPILP